MIDPIVDYRAMGRSFATDQECVAFFSVLESAIGERGKILQYQLEGLFYLLSLRERAAARLTFEQATLFAESILTRVEEQIRRENYSRLTRTALRALAAMLRYRLVNPAFVASGDGGIGDRMVRVLQQIIDRQMAPAADLAKGVLEWAERRGTDATILQWEEAGSDE